MQRRFAAIWFRYLITDWMTRRQPSLKGVPFIFAAPVHGRMIIQEINQEAIAQGISLNMAVADGRAILPGLQVFDVIEGQRERLLKALAEWCLRFTPIASVNIPDGIVLDISGCSHLWGGEEAYLKDITIRLNNFGYTISTAIADTIGAAWALSRYGENASITPPGKHITALLPLPSAALRLEQSISLRLDKLGLYQISNFIGMPRNALRRRFGAELLSRLDQALGQEIEVLEPIQPVEPYQERLPCLEPICTLTGIEIALKSLLEILCLRLAKESKGLRSCIFIGYRIDGNLQQIQIGTNRPTRNVQHIFKLFESKLNTIEPGLGIELFVLKSSIVEDLTAEQDSFWSLTNSHDDMVLAELLDRLSGKLGADTINRYLPDEHYWPERSIKLATSIEEKPQAEWRTDLPRPVNLLPIPETIEVTVPIPDYPPMLFTYKGQLHQVKKADGPERIEQEWWIEIGLYRDYYIVEDENGGRYWLFRLGSYETGEPRWFIHGFFA